MDLVDRSGATRPAALFSRRAGRAPRQRLTIALVLSLLVVLGGTLGYMLIEGWNFLDSIYMTVVSITTVGFGEVRPLDTPGRILTMVVIVSGIAIVGYSLSVIASSIVEGEITGRARERRMQRAIEALAGHVIVCGFGRVGTSVARELRAAGVPFVIIDRDLDRIATCSALGYLVVACDATDDLALSAAGIERAGSLITALDNDAQNVFITLSAHVLNPDITIAARAASAQSERKLALAGAHHVISPYAIAGHRLASAVVRPRVVEFLDTVVTSSGLEFWLEEIPVGPRSELAGKSITDADIRDATGALLLAVVRADGARLANPHPDTVLNLDDALIAIGTREQLGDLQRLASDGDDSSKG